MRIIPALALLAFAPAVIAQTGPISLTVDASQAPTKILHTTMVMPVSPGPLTLLYPKWIPGEHEPDGPIGNLAGLVFTANGKPIPWHRDTLDVYTFHLDIPSGVSKLDIAFDYLEGNSGEYTSGGSATDKLVDVSWNQNLLYPANTPAEKIMIQPRLLLPPEWGYGTALPVERANGSDISFKTADLDYLVDSPVIAGQYYRVVDLTPPGEPIHHELDLVADSAAALQITPDVQQGLTNLVAQSGLLFGSRHYRDYHFLLTLSDHVAHFGLEHHESDDSRLPERALIGPGAANEVGFLLPHEFMHSWNGKFRRPADLATPPFQAPMQDDLLWVYEGLTDYLGNLEATRSGLWSPGVYHQFIADTAAGLGAQPAGKFGRVWRPLIDTAVSVPGMWEDDEKTWASWRRGTAYYEEGDLLWLEVSTIIHDRSNGQKSLEDFLRDFYGGPNNGPELKTYTFDDIVAALNRVQPYDWAGYFHQRLDDVSTEPPMGGVESGGWHVAVDGEGLRDGGDPFFSIGLKVADDGTINDSIVDGPAYKAGVTSGMKIAGVNGRLFTMNRLQDAINTSTSNPNPIELLVINDDYYRTALVDYHFGPKAPHLVRDNPKPDLLDDILRPLRGNLETPRAERGPHGDSRGVG